MRIIDMKQNITIEQLNELSTEAYDKLQDWVDSKTNDDNSDGRKLDMELSIGQMIEFLEENKKLSFTSSQMHPCVIDLTNKPIYTEASIDFMYKSGLYPKHKKSINNICDALWQVVKEVLER